MATERSSAPVVFGHNLAIKSKRIFLSTLMLGISVSTKELPALTGPTFWHGSLGYVYGLRCQVKKTRPADLDDPVEGEQDQGYLVYKI